MNGNAHAKTTIWLGNDDGDPEGYSGYGFDVDTEDDMISIKTTLEDERGTELEIFIMRGLFPQLRSAMEKIDKRFTE